MPTRIPNLQNIDKVFTGGYYTFFQDKEGWLWGCGAVVPLEDGALEKKLVRKEIKMKKPIPGLKGIAINDTHCLYVDCNELCGVLNHVTSMKTFLILLSSQLSNSRNVVFSANSYLISG